MKRDPRAIRELAQRWQMPEEWLASQSQSFAEAAIALRFALDDLGRAILATPLGRVLTRWRTPK